MQVLTLVENFVISLHLPIPKFSYAVRSIYCFHISCVNNFYLLTCRLPIHHKKLTNTYLTYLRKNIGQKITKLSFGKIVFNFYITNVNQAHVQKLLLEIFFFKQHSKVTIRVFFFFSNNQYEFIKLWLTCLSQVN